MAELKARDVVGIGGAALTVAGVWGLWGWQCAAIALGLPLVVLYAWSELRGGAA